MKISAMVSVVQVQGTKFLVMFTPLMKLHLIRVSPSITNCLMRILDSATKKITIFLDFKLATDSETTQVSSGKKSPMEECTICFESIDNDQMFSVDKCLHRYCFSCMRNHVKAKLHEQGDLPRCPHEKCQSKLKIKSCKKFLDPELYKIMKLRVIKASIPPTENVYCPFSNCSALMSKTQVREYTATSSSYAAEKTAIRKCVKCDGLFCINCKVPWHDYMTCSAYSEKRRIDNEFMSLAAKKGWRQCKMCNHMVELASGCYHIYCRCGYQFCYKCGAPWCNKKATCRCPLWDERFLLRA